jgi:hypothetical protein
MKSKVLLIFFAWILAACITTTSSNINSSDRLSIIVWSKQIANLENRLESEVSQAQPLIRKIADRPPTSSELKKLVNYNNEITELYNELINIEPPSDAENIHEQFIDYYTATTDYVRYYVLAIKQNDLSYFDKSVIAVQETNRKSAKAHSSFESLLNRYSITCEEIDFCE